MATRTTNTSMQLWPGMGRTSQAKPHVKESKGTAIWRSDMAAWFPYEGAGSWEFTEKVLQTSLRTSCDLAGYDIEVLLANYVNVPKGS